MTVDPFAEQNRCKVTQLTDSGLTRCSRMVYGSTTHSGNHSWDGGSARDSQVAGDHYRRFEIQPWDLWEQYDLDAFSGAVIKYLLRAGYKGEKLQDLKKARHTLDRLIEIEEARGTE